ncbi:MAG: S41 family peptidase [Hymenobacter sp.]
MLNDKDPRVQYSGPLVVLVNKYSASASEILAAAIQDYKRAVVMGTATTYGKGTVQRIFDLRREPCQPKLNALEALGSLKLTIQKFYRVNGGSTQFKGVVPDIVLPDVPRLPRPGRERVGLPAEVGRDYSPARYRPWDTPAELRQAGAAARPAWPPAPASSVMTETSQSAAQAQERDRWFR